MVNVTKRNRPDKNKACIAVFPSDLFRYLTVSSKDAIKTHFVIRITLQVTVSYQLVLIDPVGIE